MILLTSILDCAPLCLFVDSTNVIPRAERQNINEKVKCQVLTVKSNPETLITQCSSFTINYTIKDFLGILIQPIIISSNCCCQVSADYVSGG